VKTIGKKMAGPSGPVQGVMVGEELHDDGKTSDKVFAPGYGEFLTQDQDGIEAMALAVPTDALKGPPPADLENVSSGADEAFDAVRSRDWKAAATTGDALSGGWDAYSNGSDVPPRLRPPMTSAIVGLGKAVTARDEHEAASAAIDVAQAALDLELRYWTPDQIDLRRFELWARQTVVDTAAKQLGAVSGDVACLEWTRDRIADRLAPADFSQSTASCLRFAKRSRQGSRQGARGGGTRSRHRRLARARSLSRFAQLFVMLSSSVRSEPPVTVISSTGPTPGA